MSIDAFYLAGEAVCRTPIIRIEKRDNGCPRRGKPGIPRLGHADISLQSQLSNSIILSPHGFNYARRIVRRGVVYDYRLPVGERLALKADQRLAYESLGVVSGNKNSDVRCMCRSAHDSLGVGVDGSTEGN